MSNTDLKILVEEVAAKLGEHFDHVKIEASIEDDLCGYTVRTEFTKPDKLPE